MRVVLDVSAVPDNPVGAGIYATELVRALGNPEHGPERGKTGVPERGPNKSAGIKKTHVELRLIARHGDSERWAEINPNAKVIDSVPGPRPLRLLWEQTLGPRFAELGDVWHGPHYTAPIMITSPTVVTIHDMTFFSHPQWHETAKVIFFKEAIRQAVERATVLVTVSEHTKSRLLELLSPAQPVMAIPLGIDHTLFSPRPTELDDELLKAAGVIKPYVFCAGTIQPRKNVGGLVRAFSRIADANKDVRLVLAGNDGWGTNDLNKAIAASRCATRVAKLGYVSRPTLAALYRHAEVVAYPAFEEGFGLPVAEALACGAAVVTTPGTSMEEIAKDAAAYAKAGDDEMLADAISALLEDSEMRSRLASKGPGQVASLTWSRNANSTINAYEMACSLGAK